MWCCKSETYACILALASCQTGRAKLLHKPPCCHSCRISSRMCSSGDLLKRGSQVQQALFSQQIGLASWALASLLSRCHVTRNLAVFTSADTNLLSSLVSALWPAMDIGVGKAQWIWGWGVGGCHPANLAFRYAVASFTAMSRLLLPGLCFEQPVSKGTILSRLTYW